MQNIKPFFLTLLVAFMLASQNSYAQDDSIGGDFSLTDHDGQPFQLQQMQGKVVLLFFGYTYCPDVCPAGLANVAAVFRDLREKSDQVQGLFITVDPERDNPKILKEYVKYFSNNLTGLTGTIEDIRKVAKQYRADFKKRAYKSDNYTMDHSASLYVIDQQGQLSTVVPYGLPAEHILNVVRHMLPANS